MPILYRIEERILGLTKVAKIALKTIAMYDSSNHLTAKHRRFYCRLGVFRCITAMM